MIFTSIDNSINPHGGASSPDNINNHGGVLSNIVGVTHACMKNYNHRYSKQKVTLYVMKSGIKVT